MCQNQDKPAAEMSYETREHCRDRLNVLLDSGEAVRVPWYSGAFNHCARKQVDCSDHFAHIRFDKPEFVQFYATPAHAEKNRLTASKPGRYLRKYYPHLGPDEVQEWAELALKACEFPDLHFTKDAYECELAYVNGPHSCMRGNFNTDLHPARVYGESPDLAIAYIGDLNTEVLARVLVRPSAFAYGKVYAGPGEGLSLKSALFRAGFRYDEKAFEGARLPEIEDPSGLILMPYLDLDYGVDRNKTGGFVMTLRNPEFECSSEHGYLDYGDPCENCTDTCATEDMVSVDGQSWCESCANEFTFNCERCCERLPTESGLAVRVDGDEVWCQDCADRYAEYCDKCDEWLSGDNFESVTVKSPISSYRNQENWCESCYKSEKAFECGDCKEHFDSKFQHNRGELTLCETCDGFYPQQLELFETPAASVEQ